MHEEVVRGISSEVLATFKQRECQGPIKGEIVIVIDGRSVKEEKLCADANIERATKKAKELVQSGETSSRIARVLAKDFGISRNSAYEIALAAVHESSQDISQN